MHICCCSLISSITQASRAIQSSENTLLIVIQKIIGVTAPVDPHVAHVLCMPTDSGMTGGEKSVGEEEEGEKEEEEEEEEEYSSTLNRDTPYGKRRHSHGDRRFARTTGNYSTSTNKRLKLGLYSHGTVTASTGLATQSRGQSQLPPCSPLYHYPSSCIGVLLASYMLRHYLTVLREPTSRNQNHFMLQDVTALLAWMETLLGKCTDLSVAYALDTLSVVATNLHSA